MIWRVAPLVVLVLVSLGAGIMVRGFVQEVLLRPAFYTIWVGELFIRSLPRGVFWGILTLATAYLAVRGLSMSRAQRTSRVARPLDSRGPVARWQHLLQRGQLPGYGQWTLARALRRLTHELLDRESTLEEESSGLAEGQLRVKLPSEFEAYFTAEVEGSHPFLARYRRWLPEFMAPAAQSPDLQVDPQDIVTYLEEETHTREKEE